MRHCPCAPVDLVLRERLVGSHPRHQQAMHGLACRVLAQPGLCDRARPVALALGVQALREADVRIVGKLAQAVALGHEPVAELGRRLALGTVEQVATIQRHRPAGRLAIARRALLHELLEVDGDRRPGPHRDRVARDHELLHDRRGDLGERDPQASQGVTGTVGAPEQRRERGPGVRLA